jgi:hypothetical protein
MKKSADADQMLDLNRIDFERVGKGNKAVYKFNIKFVNGRLTSMVSANKLAQTLSSLLMEDDVTKALLLQSDYEFSFNTKFQLHIKNIKKLPEDSKEEINAEETPLPV